MSVAGSHRTLVLAATAALLGGCPQSVPKHGVKLIYAPTDAAQLEQTRAIFAKRVTALDIRGATVAAAEGRVVVTVPAGVRLDEVKQACGRVGRLEFRVVDDAATGFLKELPPTPAPSYEETPAAEPPVDDENAARRPTLPPGVSVESEAAQGSGTHHYLAARQRHALSEYIAKLGPLLPKDHQLLIEKATWNTDPDRQWRTLLVHSQGFDAGQAIAKAELGRDPSTGSAHVWIQLSAAGGKAFADLTGANVKRRMAIVLDGEVLSAPVIQERIPGGRAQISLGGGQSQADQMSEARALAAALGGGVLPGPVELEVEQSYGS